MYAIAKLMALAIRFEQMVWDGEVADYAELARLGHVLRPRMTQIMDLLNLSPDIQEALLFWRDPVTERELRAVVAEVDWGQQLKRIAEIPLRMHGNFGDDE